MTAIFFRPGLPPPPLGTAGLPAAASSVKMQRIANIKLINRSVLIRMTLHHAWRYIKRGCRAARAETERLCERHPILENDPSEKPVHIFVNRRYRHPGAADEVERAKNRTKSTVRARVEHSIGVIKRVFGFAKVRYRGLKKNTHRLVVTCALC